MKFVAIAVAIAALLVACSANEPSPATTSGVTLTSPAATGEVPTGSPDATPEQALTLEDRGGPAYAIYINGVLATTVECDGNDFLDASDWPLPWDLKMVWVDSNTTVLSTTVSKLPAWITQFGTKPPKVSYFPVIGPVLDCPSPGASTAAASPGHTVQPSQTPKP